MWAKKEKETERGTMKVMKKDIETFFSQSGLIHFLSVRQDATLIKHSPLCLGEEEELASEVVLGSAFFSSCFFWLF